jgi:DNA polymerase III subunit epsilon
MYVVLDFETTGLDYRKEQITEIGAVRLDANFNEVGVFHTFIQLKAWNKLSEYTDITQAMVDAGVTEAVGVNQLISFIGEATVVAQYAPFDLAFLKNWGFEPECFICTKSLTSQAEPDESSSLGPTCERLGISLENAHRALDDARATAQVLEHRLTKDEGLEVVNTLVVTPGRPFNFIPKHTKRIYTKAGEIIADFN